VAYNSNGTPLYSKFTGVSQNALGVPQASFELIKPVNRRDIAAGSSKRVTHDTYTAREMAELIRELDRDGLDKTMFVDAKAKVDAANRRRGLAPSS